MDGAGPRDVGRRIGSGLFLASPAFAALAMYWLADAHLAVVAVIAVAAVTLRPIHTGPIGNRIRMWSVPIDAQMPVTVSAIQRPSAADIAT